MFEKANAESVENSFSGVAKYLERILLDEHKIRLTYKTFETYYKTIVKNNNDYNIKSIILDDLSRYLGFKDFKSFCVDLLEESKAHKSKIKLTITEKEISSNENASGIVINITIHNYFYSS